MLLLRAKKQETIIYLKAWAGWRGRVMSSYDCWWLQWWSPLIISAQQLLWVLWLPPWYSNISVHPTVIIIWCIWIISGWTMSNVTTVWRKPTENCLFKCVSGILSVMKTASLLKQHISSFVSLLHSESCQIISIFCTLQLNVSCEWTLSNSQKIVFTIFSSFDEQQLPAFNPASRPQYINLAHTNNFTYFTSVFFLRRQRSPAKKLLLYIWENFLQFFHRNQLRILM